jgi:hypothetical protein
MQRLYENVYFFMRIVKSQGWPHRLGQAVMRQGRLGAMVACSHSDAFTVKEFTQFLGLDILHDQ